MHEGDDKLTKRLDESLATDIAGALVEVLADEGYSTEEIIPGLIQAVVELAKGDDQLLDEAANLLADGGVDS
jgi:hypothetical protein